MKNYTLILGALLCFPCPVSAGGVPELIFKSGFEGKEACAIFDGFGDDLIIPTITISGDFTLNGGAFPASEYDDAIISLRHRQTGDIFEIGNTHDQNYTVPVVTGRYDILYSMETPGDFVPRNTGAVLQEDIELNTSGTLDIEVTSFMVGGDMLLNGVAFPGVQYDDAEIHLQGELTGTLELAETRFQSYADVPVLPGNYEVRYRVQTPGDTVPHNTWGRAGLVNITGNNPNLDINVNSIELTGSFSHNGVLMPAAQNEDGHFYLETDQGDRVLLDNSHEQTYTRNVLSGKYHVYWELETPSANLPKNLRARISSNTDIGSGTLNINMESHAISGDYLQNGSPFTNNVSHTAQLLLRDAADGEETLLGYSHEGSYNHRLVEASYDVIYKHIQGTEVPGNLAAVVDRFNIKIDAVMDIAIVAANFGAQIYLDEVLFPADNAQMAFVFLQNPDDSADRVLVGITPQQTLTARAITGTYDVYYNYQSGDQIPVNQDALIFSGAGVSIFAPWPPINGGLQLEVDSQVLNGDFYRNDASPPASQYDDGFVDLRIGQDTSVFGNTHDQSYGIRLIKLEEDTIYPLFYRNQTPGEFMPINGDTPIGCFLYEPLPL